MPKFNKPKPKPYGGATKSDESVKWKPNLWSKEATGKKYYDWIIEQYEKDPAEKLKFNDLRINAPPQAECCKHLREVDYDEEADDGITWVRLGYCQECREYGLRLLNLQLQWFKYRQSNKENDS